jgi:alkaline phosphatase
MSTVTSGRILKGQLRNQPGEEQITVMETLDNNALSKVNILKIFKKKHTHLIF